MGHHRGQVYVVFEFVEGESLGALLKREGRPPLGKSIRWVTQLLEAMAHAHNAGLVHRDLNPNNIQIDPQGNAKVLDFGLSTPASEGAEAIMGTVNYLAPEAASKGRIDTYSDVFSIGLIFYELLTGERAIDESDPLRAIYQLTQCELPLISQSTKTIDHRFDLLVTTALERAPSSRYANAGVMLEALRSIVDAQPKRTETQASTLGFLLRRMKRRADFPTMSKRMVELNRALTEANNRSVSELANTILKDYALTTKLLKLVNSSFYGQYGGQISTVSRAVVILGFKQVQAIAQSLTLFDQLDDKPHTQRAAGNGLALRIERDDCASAGRGQ